MMEDFVKKGSIVRKIWGSADTILFIFAGAAAEFAVNKAVDWLYFTGRLPADPLARLFSTVTYARQIVFADVTGANKAIDSITAIHREVEKNRGMQIPDWAYRDVLFMLIDYSIRSFEVLQRKLTAAEKAEVFDVFYRVGDRMQLKGLPAGYLQWVQMRQEHLQNDLAYSDYTTDLFKQYKKHLGPVRYLILKQVQALVSPPVVKNLLNLGKRVWFMPVLAGYKLFRAVHLENMVKEIILPNQYKSQIKALDVV
jgi:hypothetical protein